MTLPARRRHGRLIDRPLTGWPTMAEVDELFDRFSQLLESAATPAVTRAMAWAPLADMCETESAYVIECELPGIRREDIDVEISERELTIAGELKERERGGEVRRGTRRTGRFEYRATLPSDVRAEEVSARLADGVLTVTVPKAQAARPRHIEVTAPEGEAQAGTVGPGATVGPEGLPPEGTVRPMS